MDLGWKDEKEEPTTAVAEVEGIDTPIASIAIDAVEELVDCNCSECLSLELGAHGKMRPVCSRKVSSHLDHWHLADIYSLVLDTRVAREWRDITHRMNQPALTAPVRNQKNREGGRCQ